MLRYNRKATRFSLWWKGSGHNYQARPEQDESHTDVPQKQIKGLKTAPPALY